MVMIQMMTAILTIMMSAMSVMVIIRAAQTVRVWQMVIQYMIIVVYCVLKIP